MNESIDILQHYLPSIYDALSSSKKLLSDIRDERGRTSDYKLMYLFLDDIRLLCHAKLA